VHDGPSFAMKVFTGAFSVEPTIFSSGKKRTQDTRGCKSVYTMQLYKLPSSKFQRVKEGKSMHR
jgi:hypothetical protein